MHSDKRKVVARCSICKRMDIKRNMVTAGLSLQSSSWIGLAHLLCIKQYNKTNKHKYSILEYDENDKFLGEVTPI
jgi:hypothetical protein